MKILYSCGLDLIKHPTPGQHVVNIVRELEARGHKLTLVHQGGTLPDIEPSLQYALKLKRFRLIGRLVTDVCYAISLIKILRNKEYDCVYHRAEKWTVLPLFLFKIYKLPVVLEFNSDIRVELASINAGMFSRKAYPLSENLQVRLAKKIVVVSEGIGANLGKRIPSCKDKIVVIENGTDTRIFYPQK